MAGDRIAEVYAGQLRKRSTQRAAQERIAWIVGQTQGKRVLDCGCSQGIVPLLLAREGFEVLGIDIDPEAIAYAESALASEPPTVRERVRHQCGDVLTLPISEGAYDTVISGQVLEHVPNPAEHIALAHRACAPGGRVVITVPLGVFDHPDHFSTFYLSDFAGLVETHFEPKELTVLSKRLCFVGTRRETVLSVSKALTRSRLTELAEIEKRELETIERAYLAEIQELKQTLTRLRNSGLRGAIRKLLPDPVRKTLSGLLR